MASRDSKTLDDIIAGLSPDEREALAARSTELDREIEGLRTLRKLARRTQVQVASELGVQQPAVSRIENQTDLYLSTLRRFVEALGGDLDLVVTLPGYGTLRLEGIGDLDPWDGDEQDAAKNKAA